MKYLWISILFFAVQGRLAAQAPVLTHVLADPSGTVSLFYPAEWTELEQTEDYTRITGNNITLTLTPLPIEPIFFDDLPDWLIDEKHLPPKAFFSVESYAEREMWLGQGPDLFETGQYTALLAVMPSSRQLILLQADFPLADLSESAALITEIWRQMMVLPYHAQNDLMSVHLAEGWIYSSLENRLWSAPDESDWALLVADQTPLNIGIQLEIIRQNTTRAALLQESIILDQQEILVGGIPSTLALAQAEGQTEIILIRQQTSDQFLRLRALALDGEKLLEYLPFLKALFASWQLG